MYYSKEGGVRKVENEGEELRVSDKGGNDGSEMNRRGELGGWRKICVKY